MNKTMWFAAAIVGLTMLAFPSHADEAEDFARAQEILDELRAEEAARTIADNWATRALWLLFECDRTCSDWEVIYQKAGPNRKFVDDNHKALYREFYAEEIARQDR